jgi:hypothetical protein
MGCCASENQGNKSENYRRKMDSDVPEDVPE